MTNIENAQIKELTNKIELQNSRLEAQNTRLEQHNVHVSDMKVTLDNIQSALLGNPIGKDGGLVKRLEEVETSVGVMTKLLSEYKSKWVGIVGAIVACSGLVAFIYYAAAIYKSFIK